MSGEISIGLACDAIADPKAAAECRRSFDRCNDISGEEAKGYCIEEVSGCADQSREGADSYTVNLPGGQSLTESSPQGCFRAAVDIARSLNLKAPGKVTQKITVQHAKVKDEGASDRDTKEKFAAKPEEKARTSSAAAPWCEAATAANWKSCIEIYEICLDPEKTSFELPFGGSAMMVENRDSCMYAAAQITGSYKGKGSGVGWKTPKTRAATPPENLEDWVSDGKTKFDLRLGNTDLRGKDMRADGMAPGGASENLNLHIPYKNGRKTVQIRIEYTMEETGENRYLMKYRIAGKSGALLSDITAIEVSGRNGRIEENLAFGITLSGEGKFGSVTSVRIVSLK